jgi:transposase-like protein
MKRKRNAKMENEGKQEAEQPKIDTKAFTEALRAEVKAAGGTEKFYQQHDVIKEFTKALFQGLLESEMEEHLGYEKNDREAKETSNARN